jgi:hypothetical protein
MYPKKRKETLRSTLMEIKALSSERELKKSESRFMNLQELKTCASKI